MSILIVDDSRVARLHLRALLARAGYPDVFTAESAGEAFRHLGMGEADGAAPAAAPPGGAGGVDLILLDVVMPQRDGVEACRLIKQVEALRDIPIIMVTSQTETGHLAAAFAAGAMDYITKPSNEVELLARVRSALSLKREIDRRKARERQLLELTQQLEEANRRLERLSSLDGLTGIANRRRFDEFLDDAWRRAGRSGAPVSLLLVDIDYFKRYNDTYGHQRGDECLKQVAQAVGGVATRAGDLAARYGGEEFAVVLAGTDAAGAAEVAARLRAAVAALDVPHAASEAGDRVTVSVGLATLAAGPAPSPAALVAAADQALYRAKRAGRNRVHVFDARPAAA